MVLNFIPKSDLFKTLKYLFTIYNIKYNKIIPDVLNK